MSVISGINGFVKKQISTPTHGSSDGAVATVSSIGKWDANPKEDIPEFASSATGQAKDRVAGNCDWDGNYQAYGDCPTVFPGDIFTFNGYIDPANTKGVKGSAICDEFAIKVDIEGGKEIMHSIKFSGNGPMSYTPDAASPAYDANVSNVNAAVGCLLAICTPAASPTWNILSDIRTMDLTIKADNKAYHSSGTYDITSGKNWAKRLRGNIDLTAAFSLYVDSGDISASLATNLALGGVIGIRIYTKVPTLTPGTGTPTNGLITGEVLTNGRYWEVCWIMLQNYSGIEVDRNSVNIVGATINGGLKGAYNISNTPTRGYIKAPGVTDATLIQYWPFI